MSLPLTYAEALAAQSRAIPRVAFCIPSKSGWPTETGISIAGVCSYSYGRAKIALMTTDKNPIASARNELVKMALAFNADYILWLDADMQCPPDALLRLMAHNRDIVGVFYNTRTPPYTTVGNFAGPAPDYTKGGVHEAEIIGFGLVLCKMDVFRKLPTPWFQHLWGVKERVKEDNQFGEVGEDVFLCERARAAGIKVWVDLDLSFEPSMGHIATHIIRIGKPPGEGK